MARTTPRREPPTAALPAKPRTRRQGCTISFFRQQSSAQGRWLVPDPAGLAAVDLTNPQTWNRYAYVTNNPLSRVDPRGLDSWGAVDTINTGSYDLTIWLPGATFDSSSLLFSPSSAVHGSRGIWKVINLILRDASEGGLCPVGCFTRYNPETTTYGLNATFSSSEDNEGHSKTSATLSSDPIFTYANIDAGTSGVTRADGYPPSSVYGSFTPNWPNLDSLSLTRLNALEDAAKSAVGTSGLNEEYWSLEISIGQESMRRCGTWDCPETGTSDCTNGPSCTVAPNTH